MKRRKLIIWRVGWGILLCWCPTLCSIAQSELSIFSYEPYSLARFPISCSVLSFHSVPRPFCFPHSSHFWLPLRLFIWRALIQQTDWCSSKLRLFVMGWLWSRSSWIGKVLRYWYRWRFIFVCQCWRSFMGNIWSRTFWSQVNSWFPTGWNGRRWSGWVQ